MNSKYFLIQTDPTHAIPGGMLQIEHTPKTRDTAQEAKTTISKINLFIAKFKVKLTLEITFRSFIVVQFRQ